MPAEIAAILERYNHGFFPMFDHERDRLYWDRWPERAIIPLGPEQARRADSLRMKKFKIEENKRFGQVTARLLDRSFRPETWVGPPVVEIWRTLRDHGRLNTIEAIRDGQLLGAVMGVVLDNVFVAETMYREATDASKACLVHAIKKYTAMEFVFIDVQQPHPPDHPAARLGEVALPTRQFLKLLRAAVAPRSRLNPPL